MAKVRLRRMKSEPVILHGRYEITTHFTEIPFRYARRLVGDSGVVIEWTDKDRRDMKDLSPDKQHKYAKILRLPEGLSLDRGLFRDKDKAAKKKAEKKAAKEVKAPEPKEEVVEPELEPLPPKLEDLTVKELKKLLEERKSSTEGKKADLIKRLSEGKGGL